MPEQPIRQQYCQSVFFSYKVDILECMVFEIYKKLDAVDTH